MTVTVPPSVQEALPLPGVSDPVAGTSELEAAVRRSLSFMADQGIVDERHAGLMELALQLARTIRPGEKAYGVAQAAAQLLATFDKLMPDTEGGGDAFADLQAFLAGVDTGRGGA